MGRQLQGNGTGFPSAPHPVPTHAHTFPQLHILRRLLHLGRDVHSCVCSSHGNSHNSDVCPLPSPGRVVHSMFTAFGAIDTALTSIHSSVWGRDVHSCVHNSRENSHNSHSSDVYAHPSLGRDVHSHIHSSRDRCTQRA